MSLTTILTAPQAGMSTSGLSVTSGTWWSLLSEQDRLQCIDQGESWTIKRRRLWGSKTAWNPAGRVLERWTTEIYGTIKMIINDPGNYNKIYGDGSHHPGLGRHLWMVADRAVYQEAHPTIVIACKEKRFAKNTIQLLEEMDSFKRLNLGFRFLAHNSKVQYKATSGGLYPQSEFLENLCGIEVLLPSVPTSFNAPSSQWPRATIGGVLKLGIPCYALTVAHVLYPDNAETDDETASWSGSESEYDAEESESSRESYKSCASGEVGVSDEIRERGAQAASADEEPSISIMRPAFVDIRPREVAMATRLELSEPQNRQPYVTLGCIGHLNSIGQHESESDVDSYYDSSVWVCREWDWALIKISDPRFCRPNEIRHPAGHTLAPKSISPKSCPPKGNVLAAAGVSGIYESNCTGIVCGLTLPGTALMVDAWVINSDSKYGDSGGWILDPKNGEIHAIIVATSSSPRFTYVIPAEDIFKSIMGCWGFGMTSDSIDDILLTKISATELDASFAASFDGGGILNAPWFGRGGSSSVTSFDGESLNAASLFSQGSKLSLDTRPSTPAFSTIASVHMDKSFKPRFRTRRSERTGEILYQTNDDPEWLTKLQFDDLAQTIQANADKVLGSFAGDTDHYQHERQNAPKNLIQGADAWQQDESGNGFRILVIEGIEYIQYEDDQENIRRYREQPTAQNKKESRYHPTKNDVQRAKNAPETQPKHVARHYVHHATYASAQYPTSPDPRTSQPEIVQAAPFTLFPRDNEIHSGDGIAPPKAVASIRQGVTHELGHGVGPSPDQLSSLARSFIGLGLGSYSESANFIADNPSILRKSEIDALIAEASTAEKAGQSTKAQTCIHQALLLRECERVGASNVSSFFRKLTAKDGRAKEAFVKDVKKVYVTIQERVGSTTKQSQETTSGNTQSQAPVGRGKDGGLRYPDRGGSIVQPASSRHDPSRHDPDRHRSASDPIGITEPIAALSIGEVTQPTTAAVTGHGRGAAPLHRTVTSDSNRPLQTVVEDRMLGTSEPGGNGHSTRRLDERYRVVQKDAKKFFERGRVFAVLWDEPAGSGSGRGSKRGQTDLSDHVIIRNQFGEAVFSHIRRMVVVKESHGFCLCLAINTYRGQGVAKPGFSDEDRRAHSIIYMTGTTPSCLADEKPFLDKKPIAVDRASEDQKLDPMSRLNYKKIYTVDHSSKVMSVGRVTRDSLTVLLGYWRNTLTDGD